MVLLYFTQFLIHQNPHPTLYQWGIDPSQEFQQISGRVPSADLEDVRNPM